MKSKTNSIFGKLLCFFARCSSNYENYSLGRLSVIAVSYFASQKAINLEVLKILSNQ